VALDGASSVSAMPAISARLFGTFEELERLAKRIVRV
jgi:hypothetical protein